jgi:hypothetical protein
MYGDGPEDQYFYKDKTEEHYDAKIDKEFDNKEEPQQHLSHLPFDPMILKHRTGPSVPEWIAGTHEDIRLIFEAGNRAKFQIVRNHRVIGFAQCNVKVSQGTWYAECEIDRKYVAVGFAVGWMVSDSYQHSLE